MRNLLDWMRRNDLDFGKTKTAEKGHGSFDLYGDLERTGNPRQTADNLISHALENGMLPLFYEFADNDYYFKNLFDFSVLDLSQMDEAKWAAGEYADGSQLVYAPQQAVNLDNLMV